MKKHIPNQGRALPRLHRATVALFLAATVVTIPMRAQVAPSSSDTSSADRSAGDEAVQLDPFEVKTDKDTSYGALNSNSITRFNTELNKVPVSADVFTEEFMKDVGATSIEDMLLEYGAGMGVSSSDAVSDGELNQPGDRGSNRQMGARGMAAGAVKVDGFTSSGTMTGDTDAAFTERVEVIRGPQGLLYGAGGAGGTINTASKRARFNNESGSFSYRIDQYGSKRGVFDYNWGGKSVAYRVTLLDNDQKYRRVFIGYRTTGWNAQLAFRLPLHTTLRLQGQMTSNDRNNSTNVASLNFSKSSVDPRHNYSLTYLLATNRAGATDPVTGAAYPLGAIANGGLTWDNVNSWAGERSKEYYNTKTWSASADTVWTRWLSSQFAVRYNDQKSDRINGGIQGLSAPLLHGNPLDDWANGAQPRDIEQPIRRWSFRGSVLATNDLFHKRARSQSAVGYDADWWDQGPTDYRYYLADENWNVIYDPAIASNLGRTDAGTKWWAVGSSPVKYPTFVPGWKNPRMVIDGERYVRMPTNPRDPAWVSPNNPLGLASLAGFSGVSGQNFGGGHQENKSIAYYGTNYTSWFNDRFGTLLGARTTRTFKRNPNSTASETDPYSESQKSNASYNAGVNVRVLKWLRAYYEYSSTYNTPLANANDPLGNAPKTSNAVGHEFGLKFTPARSRISGSIEYYLTRSKDEMINAGSGTRDLINPSGLNGSYIGPAGGKNQWVNLDRETSGAEIILTGEPVRNWRLRFSAAISDGRTESNKSYPLLYNDEFYMNSAKVLTYQDGAPVMVPNPGSDAGMAQITSVIAKLNKNVNPATLQTSDWVPLTQSMINNPDNPYWANPANNNGHLQTSNLRRVLQYFVGGPHGTPLTGRTGLPLSAIQYDWSDPYNTGGQTVVAKKGEKTVGYAHYRFNLTNTYSFTQGWLRGFTVGATVNAGYDNRTYYYTAIDGTRHLYHSPDLALVNGMLSYRHKVFKRYTWTTQLNVSNVFNHYKVGLLPNNGSGYSDPTNINATFYGQPRLWVWTNTLSF